MGILSQTAWVSPTGFTASPWTSEALAYDGDTATFAFRVTVVDTWSDYLILTRASTHSDRVRIWADIGGTTTDKTIEVSAYYSGGWNIIYSGALTANQWVTYPIGSWQDVTQVQMRFYRTDGGPIDAGRVYEVSLGVCPIGVQIAWASNPFDTSPTWADISEFCITEDIDRGRLYELDRFEAGTLSLLAKNADGRFWSTNGASPYAPNVDIGKRVHVTITYNGITYDRYSGYIEAFTPDWLSDEGGLVPVMRIDCADGIGLLSRARLNNDGYAEQLPGARINSVLNNIGFPVAARQLSNGVYTIPASGNMSNVIAQQHIQDVADSEIGLFYFTPSGNAKFEGHGDRPVDHPTSEWNINNSMCDIELSLDRKLLYTETRITREGGVEQVSTNATSNANYGLSTLVKSGLLLTADSIAKEAANLLLARYEKSSLRAKSLTFHLFEHDTDKWVPCLNLDVSSRIKVVLTQANINTDYYIEAVREHYDAREDIFTIQWQLFDAARYMYNAQPINWIINPNANGAIQQLTAQGFSNGWECVSDNSDSTYVYVNAIPGFPVWKRDEYSKQVWSTGGANINSLTLFGRFGLPLGTTGQTINGALLINVNSNLYYSANTNVAAGGGVWTNFNHVWNMNPDTNVAWTANEIMNVQIGVALYSNSNTLPTAASKLYAEINYTPMW